MASLYNPGRHNVPKMQYGLFSGSNIVFLIIKGNVNNREKPLSAPGMAVPSPTAHIVSPSSYAVETHLRYVRHIHVTKPHESKVQSASSLTQNNDFNDISCLIWKVACGPDNTPLGT
jgi:hypothetical protein